MTATKNSRGARRRQRCEVLATSRLSVLVGAAGTGKTTLLRALSTLPAVASGGLLLLAPTGKARVRMQDAIGRETGSTAQTLAQLLVQHRPLRRRDRTLSPV